MIGSERAPLGCASRFVPSASVALSPFARRLRTAPRQRAQIEHRHQVREHRALSRRVRAPRMRTRDRDRRSGKAPRSFPGEPTTHGHGVCSLCSTNRPARGARSAGPSRTGYPARTDQHAVGRERGHRAPARRVRDPDEAHHRSRGRRGHRARAGVCSRRSMNRPARGPRRARPSRTGGACSPPRRSTPQVARTAWPSRTGRRVLATHHEPTSTRSAESAAIAHGEGRVLLPQHEAISTRCAESAGIAHGARTACSVVCLLCPGSGHSKITHSCEKELDRFRRASARLLVRRSRSSSRKRCSPFSRTFSCRARARASEGVCARRAHARAPKTTVVEWSVFDKGDGHVRWFDDGGDGRG
jgi:hypothetical protein